jgi:uracil-DNA glycosylase
MSEVTAKTLSPEQIQLKLIEKLEPSGWAEFLRGFLKSNDFTKLVEFLITENQEGRRFTPALKQLFRAFELCPVSQTKVIIIGQDPYPQPLVADGIAFSCGNTLKAEASLRYMLKAIDTTVPEQDRAKVDFPEKCDLERWSKQGVLLLNSALTTELTKVGKHTEQWKPFMEYLIDMLNFKQSSLIWALMGKQAREFEGMIGDHHAVFSCTHPAFAAYQKVTHWDCSDVFNKVNQQLVDYKKFKILW